MKQNYCSQQKTIYNCINVYVVFFSALRHREHIYFNFIDTLRFNKFHILNTHS